MQKPSNVIVDIRAHVQNLTHNGTVLLNQQMVIEIMNQVVECLMGDVSNFFARVQTLPNFITIFPTIPEPHVVNKLREITATITMGLFFELRDLDLFESTGFNYYPAAITPSTLYLTYSNYR